MAAHLLGSSAGHRLVVLKASQVCLAWSMADKHCSTLFISALSLCCISPTTAPAVSIPSKATTPTISIKVKAFLLGVFIPPYFRAFAIEKDPFLHIIESGPPAKGQRMRSYYFAISRL